MSLLAARSTGPLVLVPNPRLDHRWSGAAPWSYTSPKWNYELDLTHGFDEVWRHRFRSSVRRAVRKAQKSDVVVERDTTGRLMPSFLTLYEKSVLRWAEDSGVPRGWPNAVPPAWSRWPSSSTSHGRSARVA